MSRWRTETIGDCTLHLADCRDVLETLGRVDAVVSDPPYGIAFAHGGNDRGGIGKGRYATKFAKVAIAGDAEPFDPSAFLDLAPVTIAEAAGRPVADVVAQIGSGRNITPRAREVLSLYAAGCTMADIDIARGHTTGRPGAAAAMVLQKLRKRGVPVPYRNEKMRFNNASGYSGDRG